MLAVTVTPKVERSARLGRVDDPERSDEQCLVRVLQVGIDGTDRDIDRGEYGEAPPGENALIVGHESLGEIVEVGRRTEGMHKGDIVVATVRRPCPERCLNCRHGDYDFCISGHYRERGIKQRHGYLAEFYAERPEFLIPIPEELRGFAVVLEPLSIIEKAFRQISRIQERMLWHPRRALITGTGSIGLFAAFIAQLRGLEVLLYSRGAPAGAEAAVLERLDARYVDSKQRSLTDVADEFGPPDLAIEATGYSPLAWELADVVNINGIACLLSVTGGTQKTELLSDRLNSRLVLGNRLLFGSVNSHRRDFEQGVTDLGNIEARWPGILETFINRRLPLKQFREALDDDAEGGVKTVLGLAD